MDLKERVNNLKVKTGEAWEKAKPHLKKASYFIAFTAGAVVMYSLESKRSKRLCEKAWSDGHLEGAEMCSEFCSLGGAVNDYISRSDSEYKARCEENIGKFFADRDIDPEQFNTGYDSINYVYKGNEYRVMPGNEKGSFRMTIF